MPITPKDRTRKDKRKPETIIRSLRGQVASLTAYQQGAEALLKGHRATLVEMADARDAARSEVADWKRRFDALLAAIPELRGKVEPEKPNPHETCDVDGCTVCENCKGHFESRDIRSTDDDIWLCLPCFEECAKSTPQGEAAARGRE
jgi:hypothetical protein